MTAEIGGFQNWANINRKNMSQLWHNLAEMHPKLLKTWRGACKPDSPYSSLPSASYAKSIAPVRHRCQLCHRCSDNGHTVDTPKFSLCVPPRLTAQTRCSPILGLATGELRKILQDPVGRGSAGIPEKLGRQTARVKAEDQEHCAKCRHLSTAVDNVDPYRCRCIKTFVQRYGTTVT